MEELLKDRHALREKAALSSLIMVEEGSLTAEINALSFSEIPLLFCIAMIILQSLCKLIPGVIGDMDCIHMK